MSEFAPLIAKIRIMGVIETVTGLHIGAGEQGLKIGGTDNVVIKDPATGRPYVPGSSLKGKMRSLLERAGFCCENRVLNPEAHRVPGKEPGAAWGACRCGRCVVCQLFGIPAEEAKQEGHGKGAVRCAARLLFHDAHLDENCAKEMETWRYLGAPYVEVKTEVAIDRLTSAANPRHFERVPAGARFNFELVLDIFEGDDEKLYLSTVRQGFVLIAHDYLGGHGTRGYGAVKVTVNEMKKMDIKSGERSFQQFQSDEWKLPWSEPSSQEAKGEAQPATP